MHLMKDASQRFPALPLEVFAMIGPTAPDILICAGERELNIIVVRGADTADVIEAKKREAAIGETADIIMDWRSRISQTEANRDLARRVFGWLGALANATHKRSAATVEGGA
jgi:hypothetical protein